MKKPYVVYWHNDGKSKWECCTSIVKANRLKTNLRKQGIGCVWVAKDI
jgi:hypothetical protein